MPESKKVLYLGTDPSFYLSQFKCDLIHCPLIHIKLLEDNLLLLKERWPSFSHVLITSKQTIRLLSHHHLSFFNKRFIALGPSSAKEIKDHGGNVIQTFSSPCQEGGVEALKNFDWNEVNLVYPRSLLARDHLSTFLQEALSEESLFVCDLYEVVQQPPPLSFDWHGIEEVIFTSPSVVKAFFSIFESLPFHIKPVCIGPVTKNTLEKLSNQSSFGCELPLKNLYKF
ncbi:MAG: uroporphyrinogen-III synthase [Rhabdochlamydiaceae bacterium]